MELTVTDNLVGEQIIVRECTTVEELDQCVRLQREVFGLPDLEISPRRHLIVSRNAGGCVLGAYDQERLVGFVLHLAAVRGEEIFGYSHMMAVAASHQNRGVGSRLKWAQRERALAEGRILIKWTFEPQRARNAHFNLNRLGVVVRSYEANFYGTDYATRPADQGTQRGLDSDRLVAEWDLRSPRVEALSRGQQAPGPFREVAATVEITPDWSSLVQSDVRAAQRELHRVRDEFQRHLAGGLVCAGFERDSTRPRYLFYSMDQN
jgi:predicted GNAT superfamily acetyltransferase